MLKIIAIHGVSDARTNYAEDFFRKIVGLLYYKRDRRYPEVECSSFVWSDVTADRVSNYINRTYLKPNIFWQRLTKKVDPLAFQIIHYVDDKSPILSDIHSHFKHFVNVDDEVIVIAHSLGAVIAYDYLFSGKYPRVNLKAFVTVGSPLPLFLAASGMDYAFPTGLDWVDIYSHRDSIARPVQNSAVEKNIRSYRVFTGFAPIRSHIIYLSRKRVVKIVADVVNSYLDRKI